MKNKIFKSALSVILSLVIALSGFAVVSFADGVTIVTQPTRRSFYEGIDWVYPKKATEISIRGDLDLTGTVLSYNGKQYSYKLDKHNAPNMYAKPVSGKWAEGENQIKLFCLDFSTSNYAITTVNFVSVQSISVVKPPKRTTLVMGYDWNLGILNDVEYTSCNLNGIVLKVTYTDGTTQNVSYPQNGFIDWSINPDDDVVYPGDYTLYAIFGGKSAPFDVKFVKENPYRIGDVSLDNGINSLDALSVLQHVTGIIKFDELQKKLADVNSDNSINSNDALRILQYVVGTISSF